MRVRLVKTFDFEAAHHHLREDESGRRVHGHRFYVHVSQEGEIDTETGWLIDFGQIKTAVKPVIDQLDHRYLNELPISKSGELVDIAAWVEGQISVLLPFSTSVQVTCRENFAFEPYTLHPNTALELPERLAFRFEAAHSLPRTPEGHKCRRLHGHSYEVQVKPCQTAGTRLESRSSGLTRPAVEERDLLEILRALHSQLNYSCLNQIEGLENPTAEVLCRWVWERIPGAGIVVIGETCESMCIYPGD